MTTYIQKDPIKVLWAVDPFHDRPQNQLRCFEAVTKLFKKVPFEVQPVGVVALGKFDPDTHQFEEKWHNIALSSMKHLEALTAKIKHPALIPPHLIKQEGLSVSAGAQAFLKYALEEKAHLLVVSSHSRKGVERLLIGSFAESLVLRSPLPTLVVNPLSKAKSATKINKILFPTDFSKKSLQAFERTVFFAASCGMTINLFHKIQFFYRQGFPMSFYLPVSAASIQESKNDLKKQAQKWIEHGKKYNVKVSLHLDSSEAAPLDAILKESKKMGSSSLIAMASESGKAETFLLGSLTRQVLRSAACPVLVIHPHEESAISRFLETVEMAGYKYTARPAYF